MAPAHQTLNTRLDSRTSTPRKPLGSDYQPRKTILVSEQEVIESLRMGKTLVAVSGSLRKDQGRLAFGAIIVTLLIHQDRPLPKWPSLISINTLIAIFTNVMQAAMLMPIAEGVSQLKWLWFRDAARPLIDLERLDSASRGPWGCFLLLVKRIFKRHDTSHLAILGAFTTIIAMAIDPFAQQVIQYDYCSTTVPDIAAFITRTNNYTAGQRASNGGIGHSSNAMNAAFFGEGLYDPPAQASSNIRINCPAGNCTFPVSAEGVSYMSLGMCSSCEDISSTITNRTGQVADGEGKTITQVIDYVLPSNLSIPLEEHVVAATLVVTPPETLVEGMVNQSITTFEMLMTETTGCKDDLTLQGCRVWASRCSLTPCVKSYSANITNNVLHERELSSFPLQILPAAGGAAYFGIFADSSTVNGVVSDCNPTDQPTERNTLRMAEGTTWISQEYLKNVSSAPYYPPDCAFTMETASTDGLTTSLFGTYGNQNISKIFDDYNGNPWMLQLFNNGTGTPESLKTAIGGLANVITAAMRNGGDEVNSAPAAGTVILSQTCIRVHWAWLALPASLLILSSTFLACTMIQTSADSIGMAWKSSPLALLFHGFNYQTVQSVGDVNRSSEMEATARKMRARLTWEEHGWKFSKVATEKTASAGCDQAPATRNDATAQEDAALYFAPPPRYGTKR